MWSPFLRDPGISATPGDVASSTHSAMPENNIDACDWVVVASFTDDVEEVSTDVVLDDEKRRSLPNDFPVVKTGYPNGVVPIIPPCSPIQQLEPSAEPLCLQDRSYTMTRLWLERERYLQCCELVDHSLQRLQHIPSDPTMAREHIRRLRSQLATDTCVLREQMHSLLQEEVNIESFNAYGAQGIGIEGRRNEHPRESSMVAAGKEAPMVDSYLRRSGDASIARERLAELESHGDEEDLLRRLDLEADLRLALDDASALRRECELRGLDVEESRYRNISSTQHPA